MNFLYVVCPLEIFPDILVNGDGIVRSDISFRRVELKYRVEQLGVIVEFYKDELNGVSYNNGNKKKDKRLWFNNLWTLGKYAFSYLSLPNLSILSKVPPEEKQIE